MAREGMIESYLDEIARVAGRAGLDAERVRAEVSDHLAASIESGADPRGAIDAFGPAEILSPEPSRGVSMIRKIALFGVVIGLGWVLAVHTLPDISVAHDRHPLLRIQATASLALLSMGVALLAWPRRLLLVAILVTCGAATAAVAAICSPSQSGAVSCLGWSMPDRAVDIGLVFIMPVLAAVMALGAWRLRIPAGVGPIVAGFAGLALMASRHPYAAMGAGSMSRPGALMLSGVVLLGLEPIVGIVYSHGIRRGLASIARRVGDRIDPSTASR